MYSKSSDNPMRNPLVVANNTEDTGKGMTGCRGYLCGTKRRRITCYCASFTIFLIMIGVITPLVINDIVSKEIKDAAVIDGTSATNYDVWQSNYFGSGDKTDIDYDVYLFDLQNHDEALNGTKPVVVEKGPYAFRKYFNKFDISWSDSGDTVTYNTQYFYIFNPDRTGPGLAIDDEATLPYPVVLGFEYILKSIPAETEAMLDAGMNQLVDDKLLAVEDGIDQQIAAVLADDSLTDEEKEAQVAELNQTKALVEQVRLGINDYINSESVGMSLLKILLCLGNPTGISPFFKVGPVDAYFGYLNDPILVIVDQLLLLLGLPNDTWSTAVPGITANYTSESDTARRNNPLVQKTGKDNSAEIGRIVTYNGMPDQWVCVSTGDSQDPAEYTKGEEYPACELFQYDWNASTAEAKGYVRAYATDYANRIEGVDATLFPTPTTDAKIQMYIPDIYRTLYLEYTGNNQEWHDVTLRRYQLQLKDLANATDNPEEGWQYYNFAPSGMENLTNVAGFPSFASKPHFLDAATELQVAVEGINARREIHDTFLDIEPNTGLLASVHKRLQLNYQMNNLNLPEVSEGTVTAANLLCASKNVSCNGLDAALQCLAIPSDWVFYNDRVYMPYAWADESTEGSEDTADDIKDGVYGSQALAASVRLVCFIGVGVVVALVVGMFWGQPAEPDGKDEEGKQREQREVTSSYTPPM